MVTVEYLARVAFEALSPHTAVDDERADENYEGERQRVAAIDHDSVRELLLADDPQERTNFDGVRWGGRLITWPDRVPDLKVWAGQLTLAKIIKKTQAALRSAEWTGDLFSVRAPMKGTSGLDALSCPSALDAGFSADVLGMAVVQRPGVELLTIIALESVPLISYGRRDCGFVHDGKLWRFAVEDRGGYYRRIGELMREYVAE
jgi:CRISPR-associated protein Csb3